MISWNEWTDGRIAKMLRAAWLPLLMGCVGLLPFYTRDTFIGDVGDARLNMYVLEHGYRAMHHHHSASFWDAPFFYPQKNVIAYSDHHLGNLPLYAVFRGLKLKREAAFQYWTLATLALTYLSGYLALRNLGAGHLAAALAAYVFAFGLPVHGQAGHPQLLPRYLLPWVFVCASRLAALGKTRDFAWVVALMLGQVYLGIYCGVLTAVPLAGYLLATFLLGERRVFLRHMTGSGGAMAARAAILLLAAVALLPIAIPYRDAARELGMRSWKEIATMLPRLNSWLYPLPESIAWSWMRDTGLFGFRNLPFPGEHQVFAGLTMLLSLLAWPFLRLPPRRLTLLANRAWWSLVFCFVLTLSVWDWTLWSLLFPLPGIGAVRAVARIALFMLFPMSMVLAATLDALIAWARGQFPDSLEGKAQAAGAGCLLALFVFVDNGVTGVIKTSFHTANLGVVRIKTVLKAIKPGRNYVFWVCQRDTEEPFYKVSLDAMLAAQDLGVATVNGYSGWSPPGYNLMPFPKEENPPYPFCQLKEWLDLKGVGEPTKLIVIDNNGQVAWNKPGRKECPLGQPIVFTAGHCEEYLGKGFSKMEKEGVWTNRQWAEVSFKMPEMPDRDFCLTLGINTLPLAKGKQNTLRLRVNGSEIGSRTVTDAEALVWTLKVPREAASRKNGIFEIEIGSDLVLPVRECLPQSKDPRSVGLFLKTLSVE
ncbi:MAG: hypothetical protein WCH57_03490 [Verrucomicrobiota bacterium]